MVLVVVEIDIVIGIKVVKRDFVIFYKVKSYKFTPILAL